MKVTGTTCWDDPNYFDWESAVVVGEERVKEFESKYNCEYPSYRELYDTVVNWIRDNNYIYAGLTYQNEDNTVPIIDDRWLFQVSCRVWGGIIADAYPEIAGETEKDKRYAYAVWAWSAPEEERLPND